MISVFALSDLFTVTFFINKWDTALLTLLLMILAPVGLIQSIATTTGSIYQAKGKTDWMFRWGVISGVIYISGFIIGLNWGVIGVAVSYLISSIILLYPVFAIPFKLIELKFLNFIKVFTYVFSFSLIMGIIVIIGKDFLIVGFNSTTQLIVLAVLGVIIYTLLNILFNKKGIFEIKKLLMDSKNDYT